MDNQPYETPYLNDHSEVELARMNTYALHRMDHSLDLIAQSLLTRAEQAGLTTVNQIFETPAQMTMPNSEIAVEGNPNRILLPDGREVPTEVVRALAEYENVWPGAIVPEARAAIAHVVLNAVPVSDEKPSSRTNYPFCLDDNQKVPGRSSPCILRAEHRSKHRDNNDGVW